jgi:hypothetical protein
VTTKPATPTYLIFETLPLLAVAPKLQIVCHPAYRVVPWHHLPGETS